MTAFLQLVPRSAIVTALVLVACGAVSLVSACVDVARALLRALARTGKHGAA